MCERCEGATSDGVIRAHLDALATMDWSELLAAGERLGKVLRIVDLDGEDWGTSQVGAPVWRLAEEPKPVP
jgi:hypothetical protein